MTWEESAELARCITGGLVEGGEIAEKAAASGFEDVFDAARLRESLLDGRGKFAAANALTESEE
jgi:hypothetical protein